MTDGDRRAGVYWANGWVRVTFPYDAETRELLKARIGKGNYRWSHNDVAWYFLEAFAQEVIDILVAAGYMIDTDLIDPEPTALALTSGFDEQDYWKDLFTKLPPDRRRPTWIQLVKAFHTDLVGDSFAPTIMAINKANTETGG